MKPSAHYANQWKIGLGNCTFQDYALQPTISKTYIKKGWLVSLSKRFSYSIAWIIKTIKVKMSTDAKEKEIKRDGGIFEWDKVYIPHKN